MVFHQTIYLLLYVVVLRVQDHNNYEKINLVKKTARKVAQEFAHYFEDYAILNLNERYN